MLFFTGFLLAVKRPTGRLQLLIHHFCHLLVESYIHFVVEVSYSKLRCHNTRKYDISVRQFMSENDCCSQSSEPEIWASEHNIKAEIDF